MPSLPEIRAANAGFAAQQHTLTAVFVGATSGIGLSTIRALLTNTHASTIFIIGRSASKFASTLSELQSLDPSARITFLEAQVSLLKEVERVCASIRETVTSIDLLWLSQGGLSSKPYSLTSEGVFEGYAITIYSRILFIRELLPCLTSSERGGRVISVLSAGQEGPLTTTGDFSLRDSATHAALGFWGTERQAVTMMSLTLSTLARQHPSVVFVHTNPGLVSTDVHEKWAASMTGWFWMPIAWAIRWVFIPLRDLVGTTPGVAGEVGFFEAVCERFAAGGNFWRVSERAEVVEKGRELLAEYEREGMGERVWEDTGKVFERVLGG